MFKRLVNGLRPKPVQIVQTDEEAVVATWALNLKTVAAALDAQAEGAAALAAEILNERKARRRTVKPSETLP